MGHGRFLLGLHACCLFAICMEARSARLPQRILAPLPHPTAVATSAGPQTRPRAASRTRMDCCDDGPYTRPPAPLGSALRRTAHGSQRGRGAGHSHSRSRCRSRCSAQRMLSHLLSRMRMLAKPSQRSAPDRRRERCRRGALSGFVVRVACCWASESSAHQLRAASAGMSHAETRPRDVCTHRPTDMSEPGRGH